MKRFFYIAVFLTGIIGQAQVGIGNTNPKSSLDISATNTATPAATDGILIPRIDAFPVTDPGVDQDGMLVFVTGNGVPSKGFYYWDQAVTTWVAVTGGAINAAWYEEGTSTVPANINDNIFTQGNVSIGTNVNSGTLTLEKLNTSNGVSISNIATGSVAHTGILNDLNFTTSGNIIGLDNAVEGNGVVIGIRNDVTASGTNFWGMQSNFDGNVSNLAIGFSAGFQGSAAKSRGFSSSFGSTVQGEIRGVSNEIYSDDNGFQYGVYNLIDNDGTGSKYGCYTNIDEFTAGTHYGVYSDVRRPNNYAGYFIGRLSLGEDPLNDRYIMPTSDGTNGQLVATNGSGQLGFIDAPADVANFAMAKIIMSSAQSIPASSYTKLNFDTVAFDLNSNFNTVNDRFIVSEAGVYRIDASAAQLANNTTTGIFNISIYVNGTAVKYNRYSHHGVGSITRDIRSIENLNAGDYIEVFFFGNSTLTITPSTTYTTFEVERIR